MYQKNKEFETHKATIDLDHTTGAWDYKSRSKTMFYDNTTRKQFSPLQFADWLNSPHIRNMIQRGANLKIATQDIEGEPNKYSDGLKRKIIFYFSMPKNGFSKTQNLDGMKPIGQSIPRYKEMPMTEAQPSAPDHAKSVDKMQDMDDDLPPF